MKLSECNNGKYLFLYDEKIVGLQYILNVIWNEQELSSRIQLIEDDENLREALSDVLTEMSHHVVEGIEKEAYELSNVNLIDIEVDVTKKDIDKLSKTVYMMHDKE